MDRRKFLKSTVTGLGTMAMLPACAYDPAPFRFFTQKEAECVIALTDQIIPADESGPGAVYANVVNYIDQQLVRVFRNEQSVYKKGITALQNSCKKIYGQLFHELEFDTQTDFLIKVESNNVPKEFWDGIDPAQFFSMVIRHTMQGFYGSPVHGGNKNYISYRLMKLEYPQVVGQNRYRRNHGE
ncbi:gluconate 2-dehydrogenase subunit 3 family protein [candidate division KSB1 bacterium]|nr:gluconate 2-dehydrogenase subunit 3 family protein [candidate division KSB1 bacterium]